MEDSISKIIKYHLNKYPNTKVVKITTTRYYEIPPSEGYSSEELLEEWFNKTPITYSHAFRDGSLLIEHFNKDASFVNPT